MDTEERLDSYASRHASVLQGHTDEVALTEHGEDWLTPAQRRRVRHKENSPRTHSHEQLLEVPDAEGNFHRQSCPECFPRAGAR